MATVSLSPAPVPFTAMSTRRAPLSSNPNAANSPLRGSAGQAALFSKQKRSYASAQREELYGQPPPAKKQMLNNATSRAVRSPTKQRLPVPTASCRNSVAEKERAVQQPASKRQQVKVSEQDVEAIQKWANSQRAQFPRHVFYFDSVPEDIQLKLRKQVQALGAREEKFFSIDITHVVTTRSIPSAQSIAQSASSQVDSQIQESHDQPQTINPSLLSRATDAASTKRKLFDIAPTTRRPPINQLGDDIVRRPKVTRNVDLLERAREMSKRIWPLEKFQRIMSTLLEQDPYRAAMGFGVSGRSQRQGPRPQEDASLLQALNKERLSGPSDRDPTASAKELHMFKGPHIYIYDIEEKQRPIMVREYAKVSDKQDGDWPQLRASGSGRCPFVEDEVPDKASKRAITNAAAVNNRAVESAPKLQPPIQDLRPKPVTGKRTLAEMDDAALNRGSIGQAQALKPTEIFAPAKINAPPTIDFHPGGNNAFTTTSRARPARFFAGEPVASGLQPSGVTSAIRSQMVSSTTGQLGAAKTGVSKEVMGLQRKVLQKSGSTSQNPSSRRHAEMSLDSGTFARSASLGNVQKKLEAIDEAIVAREEKHKRTHSIPTRLSSKPKKREPKPGYCENCQDKFDDFDDHIQSRTHRKFAENDDNWEELDRLLVCLRRYPIYNGSSDTEYQTEACNE